MDSRIFCTVLFAVTLTAVEGASIAEGPRPVTAEVGQDVNITCKISMSANENEAIRWTRIVEVGNPTGETIYTYPLEEQPKKSDKYQILRHGQNFDLRILNLDFYDGGLYHCQLVLATQIEGADLVVLISEGAPSFIHEPSDVTAAVGDSSVNFTCGIKWTVDEDKDTLRWSRLVHVDQPYGEVLYTYYFDKESEDPNKFTPYGNLDKLTLQVHDIELGDAGIYVCEMIKSAQNRLANLIVLDTPVPITPSTTVKSGSVAQLTCEATFAAPREEEISEGHFPVMETYLDTQKLTVKEEVFPGLPGTKWWLMRQTANVTTKDADDGKDLICSIETSNPYYHLEAKKSIFVQHAVSTVSVQNANNVYYVGDFINCTANGNPEPEYEWHPINIPQMTGARVYQSQQLEITRNLVGQNTWKCVARNTVGEKITKEVEISFEVQPSPYDAKADQSTGGGSNTAAIAVGVVVPIVVIGVVLLIGFLVYRRKSRMSRYKSTDIFGVTEDKTKKNSNAEKTPDVPKELPPNPKPPGHMRMMPPQVYDPEEGKKNAMDLESGTPLLEQELRPARPSRPTPQPRNHHPESASVSEDDSKSTEI